MESNYYGCGRYGYVGEVGQLRDKQRERELYLKYNIWPRGQ